jgi:hypothetical protein
MDYQIEVTPSSRADGINALELADFLQKFRAAYVVATWFIDYELSRREDRIEFDDGHARYWLNDALPQLERQFELFLRTQRALPPVATLARHRLSPEEELVFQGISTNSPIRFIGYCTGTSLAALALAVAISGGEADLKNMKFTVQPMADAIVKIVKELRR